MANNIEGSSAGSKRRRPSSEAAVPVPDPLPTGSIFKLPLNLFSGRKFVSAWTLRRQNRVFWPESSYWRSTRQNARYLRASDSAH